MDIEKMRNKVREALAVQKRLIHKDYYDVIPVGDDKCVFYYCSQQFIDLMGTLQDNSRVCIHYSVAIFKEGEVSIDKSMRREPYAYKHVLTYTPAQAVIDFARSL